MTAVFASDDCDMAHAYIDQARQSAAVMAIRRLLQAVKHTASNGQTTRRFHCYRKAFVEMDQREVQRTLWLDIQSMDKRDARRVCQEYKARSSAELAAGEQFLTCFNAERPPSRQLQFDFGD